MPQIFPGIPRGSLFASIRHDQTCQMLQTLLTVHTVQDQTRARRRERGQGATSLGRSGQLGLGDAVAAWAETLVADGLVVQPLLDRLVGNAKDLRPLLRTFRLRPLCLLVAVRAVVSGVVGCRTHWGHGR